MEIFFLLAGFFACLVIDIKGIQYFLHDQWIRIALVFLVLLYPMKFLVSIPWIQGGLKSGWLQLPPAIASLPLPDLAMGAIVKESFPDINTGHLWFLYFLAVITCSFVAIRWLIMKFHNRNAARDQKTIENGFYRFFSSGTAPLLIALAMVPVFAMTPRYLIDSPDYSLAIDYPALVIFGFFFIIG
jgi:glucans biosynthesis protein C